MNTSSRALGLAGPGCSWSSQPSPAALVFLHAQFAADLCLEGHFALAVLSPFILPCSLAAAAEQMDGFDGEGYSLLLRHWGGSSALVLWQGGHTGKVRVKHSPSSALGLLALQQVSHSDQGFSWTGFCFTTELM